MADKHLGLGEDWLLPQQFQGCIALAFEVTGRAREHVCALVWSPGDAPTVRPIGVPPDKAWEVCHDGTGAYDQWYVGTRKRMTILKNGMTLEQAVSLFLPVSK